MRRAHDGCSPLVGIRGDGKLALLAGDVRTFFARSGAFISRPMHF